MTTAIAASEDRSRLHAGGVPAIDHSWPFLDDGATVVLHDGVAPLKRAVASDGLLRPLTQEIFK